MLYVALSLNARHIAQIHLRKRRQIQIAGLPIETVHFGTQLHQLPRGGIADPRKAPVNDYALARIAEPLRKSGYGEYLLRLLERPFLP